MSNRLYKNGKQLDRPSGNKGVRTEEKGRSAFRKDYARLLHAPSFRRLQGKTQLFPGSQSDYFRNRLTHSLEVAQIARGIAGQLNAEQILSAFGKATAISEDLVEFASIAHDLGHPPFGHNGEYALDELMRGHGGFEGNAQTLRILACVERKLVNAEDPSPNYGLDLTYRSLASVLKYDFCIPVERPQNDPLRKGYYKMEASLVKDIKKKVAPRLQIDSKFKTIECAIMDIADDIAYSTYDLEDSLHAGFYSPLDIASEVVNNENVTQRVISKTNKALSEEGYSKITHPQEILEIISTVFDIKLSDNATALIKGIEPDTEKKYALTAAIEFHFHNKSISENGLLRTRLTAERVGNLIQAVELVPNEEFPQLSRVRLKREQLLQVEVMKHLNYEIVVTSPRLAVIEHRGKDIVKQIFGALIDSKGALLPTDWRQRYNEAQKNGDSTRRIICDFVACMTDRYAIEFHARLFGEDSNIYKPI